MCRQRIILFAPAIGFINRKSHGHGRTRCIGASSFDSTGTGFARCFLDFYSPGGRLAAGRFFISCTSSVTRLAVLAHRLRGGGPYRVRPAVPQPEARTAVIVLMLVGAVLSAVIWRLQRLPVAVAAAQYSGVAMFRAS
jgi:hypothetical protein